ncbi:hypothetical protein LINPERPRIM_LOCUS28011, partial [Linum perenne]
QSRPSISHYGIARPWGYLILGHYKRRSAKIRLMTSPIETTPYTQYFRFPLNRYPSPKIMWVKFVAGRQEDVVRTYDDLALFNLKLNEEARQLRLRVYHLNMRIRMLKNG